MTNAPTNNVTVTTILSVARGPVPTPTDTKASNSLSLVSPHHHQPRPSCSHLAFISYLPHPPLVPPRHQFHLRQLLPPQCQQQQFHLSPLRYHPLPPLLRKPLPALAPLATAVPAPPTLALTPTSSLIRPMSIPCWTSSIAIKTMTTPTTLTIIIIDNLVELSRVMLVLIVLVL